MNILISVKIIAYITNYIIENGNKIPKEILFSILVLDFIIFILLWNYLIQRKLICN
jgi:hypothetical protein